MTVTSRALSVSEPWQAPQPGEQDFQPATVALLIDQPVDRIENARHLQPQANSHSDRVHPSLLSRASGTWRATLERPVRVIFNDRVLYRPLTGVGHYVQQLLAALVASGDEVAVHPFLSGILPAPRAAGETAPSAVTPAASAAPPSPSMWSRLRGAWWVRRILQGAYRAGFCLRGRGYDLYHEPNHIPVRCSVPTITTVHDLSVIVHPEWHPADRVRWYEREFARGCRQTRRFIAASDFTRREMLQVLGVPAERIDVTYQAPRPRFRPRPPVAEAELRARFGLPASFFLFVGTLEPRKNVTGLLEAFAGLPAETRRRHPLALAGGWGWRTGSLAESLRRHGLGDDVRPLGYLSDGALADLYASCTALVWPTWYEGFGLPPLEAMACGAPVIVSNVASLPEVVGDAGVLLDPGDAGAWTKAMQRVVDDADWRDECRRRGLARAATFTWSRCAEQTIASYRAALARA